MFYSYPRRRRKRAGSKLKWLLWSINLHEKIIKGVGVGAAGTKWKLNSFGIQMIHCVVCNAWCSVWTGAKSIRKIRLDDSFSRICMTKGRRAALCCNDQSSQWTEQQQWLCAVSLKMCSEEIFFKHGKSSCLTDVMKNEHSAQCVAGRSNRCEMKWLQIYSAGWMCSWSLAVQEILVFWSRFLICWAYCTINRVTSAFNMTGDRVRLWRLRQQMQKAIRRRSRCQSDSHFRLFSFSPDNQ